MGSRHPFQLIQNELSHDTIDALGELCTHARRLELIGIAYIAMYRGRSYIVDCTGEAYRNPTFTRGMLRALDDKLAQMVGSRD